MKYKIYVYIISHGDTNIAQAGIARFMQKRKYRAALIATMLNQQKILVKKRYSTLVLV